MHRKSLSVFSILAAAALFLSLPALSRAQTPIHGEASNMAITINGNDTTFTCNVRPADLANYGGCTLYWPDGSIFSGGYVTYTFSLLTPYIANSGSGTATGYYQDAHGYYYSNATLNTTVTPGGAGVGKFTYSMTASGGNPNHLPLIVTKSINSAFLSHGQNIFY